MFARLAVNLPAVSGTFDYALPPEIAGQVGVGCLVTAPFGKQMVQGVILELVEQPSVAETKPIASLLDPMPVLTLPQIELAKWMSGQYLQPVAAMIGLMLPVGMSQQADMQYSVISDQLSVSGEQSPVTKRLLNLLNERGPLRGRQIDRHFARVDWRRTAALLIKRGVLKSQAVLPTSTIRPKFIRMAQLAAAPDAAEAAMSDLGKTDATRNRRESALRFLMRAKDAVNVAWVYAESGCNLADLQELAERELIVLRESEIWRDPLQKIESIEEIKPVLTPEQARAWESIQVGFATLAGGNPVKPFLLHGVTGSGKTEIYLRAAEETVRRGKQAIILVPEIALTPQTVRRFLARFPGQVGLVHSKLSEGERYDTWRRARAGLLKLVIGARSALFAPMPNLGLIVADECHDGSYYQSEPPFYHAVNAAQTYARLAGAVCILGSATPSLGQRYQAEAGESLRLELPRRIPKAGLTESALGLPPVSIIDMREELKQGNRGIFSRALLDGLQKALANGEQAILFLNRRGTATYVFCRDCGSVLKCPHCDTPLTYHVDLSIVKGQKSKVGDPRPATLRQAQGNAFNLLCHRCGYMRQMPKKCSQCGSAQIREYGLGSEKVEAEVQALFPQARTLRWDWETTRQKDAHELILTHFANHKADVLVGTQMLAKGLDLPLVTLVGIVLADVGLSLPDPFAAERVFQVLTQVAGRAGRSARGGQVVLQTFQPESEVVQFAARHDYEGFYQQELSQRRRLGYPPFGRLARLEIRDLDAGRAEAAARQLAGKLAALIQSGKRVETSLIGPVPAFFSKLGGFYRWQILVRGPDPISLLRGLPLTNWRVEVEPISLL